MTNALVDTIDRSAEKESGSGLIALVELQTGYKSFAKGVPKPDSFFPCDFSVDADGEYLHPQEVNVARAKAKALSAPTNAKTSQAFQMTVFKDTVKNYDTSGWKGDVYHQDATWTDAWHKIIKVALAECNIEKLGKLWAHIAFADNPSGRTKINDKGAEVPEQVAYIAEWYPNESAAAIAAFGGDEAPEIDTSASIPEAWNGDPDGWVTWTIQVKQATAGMSLPDKRKAILKLANEQDLGATVDEVLQAIQ